MGFSQHIDIIPQRLSPRIYSDGEEYYPVNWEEIKPEDCSLDYDTLTDHKGIYSEIFDLNTKTVICRTRSYHEEAVALNAAEFIIDYLRDEFDFEKNTFPTDERN